MSRKTKTPEILDLCSSDDESTPTPPPAKKHKADNAVICLGDSDDESTPAGKKKEDTSQLKSPFPTQEISTKDLEDALYQDGFDDDDDDDDDDDEVVVVEYKTTQHSSDSASLVDKVGICDEYCIENLLDTSHIVHHLEIDS